MRKNRFDFPIKENGAMLIKEKISNFFEGLGIFFVVVLSSVTLFIIIVILTSGQWLEWANLYFVFYFLCLLLYSVAFTKTVDKSLSYKTKQLIKSLFDIGVATFSIFFLSPLMFLIALFIVIDSPGPIMYWSKRIGQFGKPIYILRYRTMHIAPTEQPITRVGRFLRRTHFVELPTLFNVIRGEISFVGPVIRPFNDTEALNLSNEVLSVKPGIMGPWYATDTTGKDSISVDLEYVQNWSLVLDFKILLAITVATIFSKYKQN